MDRSGVIERFAAAVCADPSSFCFDDVRALIADLVVCRNVLDHALTVASARADELAAAGSGPGAEQLLRSVRCSNADAAAVSSRAAVLRVLPAFQEALAAGEISGAHVDAVAPVLRDLDASALVAFTDPLVVDGLLGVACREAPCRVGVAARQVADKLDERASETEAARLHRLRRARFTRHRDGTVSLHTRFGAEGPEVRKLLDTETALRRAAQKDVAAEERSTDEQLACDALTALIRGGALTGASDKPVAPMAIVKFGYEDLLNLVHGGGAGGIVTSDGMPLTEEAARRLLADAQLVPVLLDQSGLPIELARAARQRLATMIQRAVLATMYTTCMIPGCDTPFDDCQIHHIDDFNGHNTVLSNLGPVCPHEHGGHHAQRLVIGLDEQRTVTVTLPDGSVWATQDYQPPDHMRRRPKPPDTQAPPQPA
jgi:hypothetical protein